MFALYGEMHGNFHKLNLTLLEYIVIHLGHIPLFHEHEFSLILQKVGHIRI